MSANVWKTAFVALLLMALVIPFCFASMKDNFKKKFGGMSTEELGGNFEVQFGEGIAAIQSLIGPIAVLMLVLAGIIYAVGQTLDSKTREKAQAWSYSMIVGTVAGVLIVVVAPWIVEFLIGMGG